MELFTSDAAVNTKHCLAFLCAAIAATLIHGLPAAGADCPIQLVDVTKTSGISFQHNTGGSGLAYIVEGMSAGLALFDYDNDGLIDMYFLNGAPLKGSKADKPLKNALYRNNGDWTFTDVTEQAGVGDTGYGLGVAVADYDNDGDQDIYLNNFGPNVLLRNNGDKTFTGVTEQAGVGNGNQVGAGACFLDLEQDGDLDLYVGNYVDFTYEHHVPIVIGGKHYQAGPQYYNPVPDTLYRNEGNGTFTDISSPSGIAKLVGPSMAVMSCDFDDDGDTDIFVCNDGKPNFLFTNDGKGNFSEDALLAGVACDFYGKANASMGVDCGDINRDGNLDLFVTDYQSEMPVLYRGLGAGIFEDATSAARIPNALFPHVHWGTGFVDFDNDGHSDLFVACGHFDRIELIDDRTALKIRNYLMRNSGDGKFVDVSTEAGSGLAVVESSRGAAFDDLDNDGDVDVVILNSNAPPTILRNESNTGHRWLQVQLEGTTSNKDAIGAKVEVVLGAANLTSRVCSGRGYQSHFGSRLYFGLGGDGQVERIRVTWPDNTTETFAGATGLVRIKQGEGEGR